MRKIGDQSGTGARPTTHDCSECRRQRPTFAVTIPVHPRAPNIRQVHVAVPRLKLRPTAGTVGITSPKCVSEIGQRLFNEFATTTRRADAVRFRTHIWARE